MASCPEGKGLGGGNPGCFPEEVTSEDCFLFNQDGETEGVASLVGTVSTQERGEGYHWLTDLLRLGAQHTAPRDRGWQRC